MPPFFSTTPDKEVRMNNATGLSDAQIRALLEPFDKSYIHERRFDSQLVVSHDYVRGRLSEIFGPLGWSEQTLECTEVPAGEAVKLKYIAYRARVRVTIHPHGTPVAYWDGAGAWGQGRDLREANPMTIWDLHSDCMNGALSVAFLRATKNLGNSFGLSLYSPTPDKPGYEVREFLTHPLPEQDGHEGTQEELGMGHDVSDSMGADPNFTPFEGPSA